VVVSIGRLEKEKDPNAFLNVAKQFKDARLQDIFFILAGTGSLAEGLMERVRAESLDNVRFLGYRSDIPSILSQADCFLLTSQSESFGMVLLEAMEAGCPIVATRSSGPESIIQHGQTGFLIEKGDDYGLFQQVRKLLADKDLRARVCDRAKGALYQAYDQGQILAKYAEIYRNPGDRGRKIQHV
jgi:glycosyltransferase involved in cell wall biosynthesis